MKRAIITAVTIAAALIVGIIAGERITATRAAAAYTEGYQYAVETARLTAEDGDTYVITYGYDDGNEYAR